MGDLMTALHTVMKTPAQEKQWEEAMAKGYRPFTDQDRAKAARAPRIRPRQALGEGFFRDMQEAWERHGKAVINRIIDEDPGLFLAICAKLMPKEMKVETRNLTHEQRTELVVRALRSLAQGSDGPNVAGIIGGVLGRYTLGEVGGGQGPIVEIPPIPAPESVSPSGEGEPGKTIDGSEPGRQDTGGRG